MVVDVLYASTADEMKRLLRPPYPRKPSKSWLELDIRSTIDYPTFVVAALLFGKTRLFGYYAIIGYKGRSRIEHDFIWHIYDIYGDEVQFEMLDPREDL